MNNNVSMIYKEKKDHNNNNINININNNNNNVVEHTYTDHAHDTGGDSFSKLSFLSDSTRSSSSSSTSCSSKAIGITVPFPLKLHEMLDQIEEDGLASVISWQPHGRCFVVHDQKKFASEVMAKYFRQTKFASFQRQLNLYGFNRLTSGRDKGGYYNDLFLRGKRFLCHRIQRIKIKGTGVRKASSPETEPQFYSMNPVGVPGQEEEHPAMQQSVATNNNNTQQHAQGSSSSTRVTQQAATPVLPLSSMGGGYPQQQWNEQMAMNQAMLNNHGYNASMQQQQPNPLAVLSNNACSSNNNNNTTIQDMQRMILDQQAKLTLAQNALQQAASVFPDIQSANAALMQQSSTLAAPQQGDVANQIATMIRQKLREQKMAAQKQQQQQFELSCDDDDESQKEFDQLLGALVGMPTEPTTPTHVASSNPFANNNSLANLYEMITE